MQAANTYQTVASRQGTETSAYVDQSVDSTAYSTEDDQFAQTFEAFGSSELDEDLAFVRRNTVAVKASNIQEAILSNVTTIAASVQ